MNPLTLADACILLILFLAPIPFLALAELVVRLAARIVQW